MAETKTAKPRVAKKAPEEVPQEVAQASEAPKTAPKASKKAHGYAVIMTGGKQYRVIPGQSLKIEKLLGEHKEGDTLTFDQVLLIDDGMEDVTLGTPLVSGAKVSATLTKISRYKTIDVIKYKQKSRYFKKNGHRQPFFEVTIDSIK
jgi:large subunit ribosomal protein L21